MWTPTKNQKFGVGECVEAARRAMEGRGGHCHVESWAPLLAEVISVGGVGF